MKNNLLNLNSDCLTFREFKNMYLFFKVETNGLPNNWNAPISDLKNWPRLIRLSWKLTDDNGNRIESNSATIKPDNFSISKEASDVNGITTEIAMNEGVSITSVLTKFNFLIDQADFIVSHNIRFGKKIIECELLRNNFSSRFFDKTKIDVMKSSIVYCKLPSPYGFKYPKLTELYSYLFNQPSEETRSLEIIEGTSCGEKNPR